VVRNITLNADALPASVELIVNAQAMNVEQKIAIVARQETNTTKSANAPIVPVEITALAAERVAILVNVAVA